MIADVDPTTVAGGVFGLFGLVIAVLALILAIAWLLLPFLILSSLRDVRAEIEASNKLAAEQIRGTKTLATALESLASEQQITNQHLQNLFDAANRANQLLDWGAETAARHLPPPP